MDAILVAYFFKKKDCVSTVVDDFKTSNWNSTSDAREIRHIDLNYQTYGFIALRKGLKKSRSYSIRWRLKFISHESFLVIPSIIMSIWNWYIFWAESVSRDPEVNEIDFPTAKKCFLTSPKFYRSWLTIFVPSFAIISRSLRIIWFGWRFRREKQENHKAFFWKKWVSEKQDLNTIQGTVVIEGFFGTIKRVLTIY